MDENEHIPDDFLHELDRLAGEAGRKQEKPFERPSDEAINAYLSGNASDEQKRHVQDALRASSAFRQELAILSSDLERLCDPDVRKEADAWVVPPTPDLDEIVFTGKNTDSADGPTDSSRTNSKAAREVATEPNVSKRIDSGWHRATRIFGLPWFIPTAVAAMLILLIVKFVPQSIGPKLPSDLTGVSVDTIASPSQHPITYLAVVNDSVPPRILFELTTRSAETGRSTDVSKWADSVAIRALTELLHRDPATNFLNITLNKEFRHFSGIGIPTTIQLVDTAEHIVCSLVTALPQPRDSVVAWILGFPGGPKYRLFSAPLSADTLRLAWSPLMGKEGAIVLVRRVNNQFHALAGFTFRL